MTKNTWKTKDGKILKISDMTDEHLINAVAFVERRAEDGLKTSYNVGSDTDSYYAVFEPNELLFDDDVKEFFGYNELVAELDRRGLQKKLTEEIGGTFQQFLEDQHIGDN